VHNLVIGWGKTFLYRSLEGKLKDVTVSRTKSGRDTACFQVEVKMPHPVYRGSEIGLDLGLKEFTALLDGRKLPNSRHLIQAEKWLRSLQRSLSRRQVVPRQHEKVANCRAHNQHKLSRPLAFEHRLLAIEDLHIKRGVH
jgi:putative transposase